MAKPVVIEVNNKCGCHWNAGNSITLTNQHPDGNAPFAAHAFQCRVLDDRGLYLYVDSRPSGYRFWCTHCKTTDPMSFTYFTDQQTEFIYGMLRRYSQQEEVKKKLEKKIQDISDTLTQERERFELELTNQTAAAEKSLSEALSEAQTRDVHYKSQESKWSKENAAKTDFETKKAKGLNYISVIQQYDFNSNSNDCIGETTRDFMKACEDMTTLVDPLLQVQKKIESCKKEEDRLLLASPHPSIEKKNSIYMKLLITVLGTEPSQNAVPFLQVNAADPTQPPTPLVHVPFEFLAVNAATQNIRRLPKQNYRLCPNHDITSQDAACNFFHIKCIRLYFPRVGEVLIPGVFVRDRNDLQNPPAPRHENMSAPEGCVVDACHCKNRVHIHKSCVILLFSTWFEREDIWKYCIATTESDDMSNQLDKLKKQRMRFDRFLARHPHILSLKNNNTNNHEGTKDGNNANKRMKTITVIRNVKVKRRKQISTKNKSGHRDDDDDDIEDKGHANDQEHENEGDDQGNDFYEEEEEVEEEFEEEVDDEDYHEDSVENNNNNYYSGMSQGEGEKPFIKSGVDSNEDDDDLFETDEEAEEFYPDGTIESLDGCVNTCFGKARANMMIEYQRIRGMHLLLCDLDFHFLQLQEYADAIQLFHLTRDLDKLMVDITSTARRCGALVETPKPNLGNEGKGFAVGVALIIRETERTFEELANLRDRVDNYKSNLEKSEKARKMEAEIESIERQIDLKQREIQRGKRKIDLFDAELEVLADAEGDDMEAQDKRADRTKTVNDINLKRKELAELQDQHHDRFVVLVDTRDKIVPDLDLKHSEQERWRDLLGEGNDVLAHSKNLVDFVKNKRQQQQQQAGIGGYGI